MSHDPHADPDMLRPEPPVWPGLHVHYWAPVDRAETLYRCRYCRLTWAPTDDPDDHGGRAA